MTSVIEEIQVIFQLQLAMQTDKNKETAKTVIHAAVCASLTAFTVKLRLNDIALMNKSSQSYGAGVLLAKLTIWDHTVFVTRHPTQVNTPRRNPSQTGWYSIELPLPEG